MSENRVPGLIRRLLGAWLFAVLAEYLLLPANLRDLSELSGLAAMSFPRVVLVTVCGFLFCQIFLMLRERRGKRPVSEMTARRVLFGLIIADVSLAAVSSRTLSFMGACLLIVLFAADYARHGFREGAETRPKPCGKESNVWKWFLALLAAGFIAYDSVWMIARIRSFSVPTYDFGIFSQMFSSMKETGLPLTTLERDGLLSHFCVHVSPIWYLLLPFYALVPRPETLEILQAVVLASAVIPLWKLGKHHGLSAPARFFLCAALLFYPALTGGTNYDIHENCFLTPLLLWLFYGLDQRRTKITVLAAALTLLVKEDAAVYVAVIGLWEMLRSLVREKDRYGLRLGAGLFLGALLWFLGVTAWLSRYGEGVMSGRYENYMYDGGNSLLTVVKAVILQPMKAVYECADPEKLPYLALTMLPLLGLPLLTRKYERYVLLIPYVLVNLMPDYGYQHNIFYQYTFGSAAFLFYLTVVNLKDLRGKKVRAFAAAAVTVLCAVCFVRTVVPVGGKYIKKAQSGADIYREIREELALVPKDVPAAATSFYTLPLSNRKILYDLKNASREHLLEAEVIVLDPSTEKDFVHFKTSDGKDGLAGLLQFLEENGYEKIPGTDRVMIYRRLRP